MCNMLYWYLQSYLNFIFFRISPHALRLSFRAIYSSVIKIVQFIFKQQSTFWNQIRISPCLCMRYIYIYIRTYMHHASIILFYFIFYFYDFSLLRCFVFFRRKHHHKVALANPFAFSDSRPFLLSPLLLLLIGLFLQTLPFRVTVSFLFFLCFFLFIYFWNFL